MARQLAMAQLQAALAAQPTQLQPKQSTGGAGGPAASLSNSVSLPHAAPDPPTLILQQRNTQTPPQTAAQDQLAKDQDTAAKDQALLARQQKQDNTRAQALIKRAQGAANTAGQIVKGTKIKLEGVPTPGSLMFPLLVLLFLFLILIPVNGYSRLQWLWFTVIGDAAINETAHAPGNQTPQQQLPAGGQGQEAAIPLVPALSNGRLPVHPETGIDVSAFQPFTTMEVPY
jgi:hypothetical protein